MDDQTSTERSRQTKAVAVLIPTLAPARWLPACFASLASQTFTDFEVVVIDNRAAGADHAALPVLPALPSGVGVRVVVPGRNLGFPEAINRGAAATTARLVVVLNDDARLAGDWLARMVETMRARPEIAIACGKVVAEADPSTIDSAGDGVGPWWLPYPVGRFERDTGRYDTPREPFLTGMCAMIVRRECFDEVGGLEPSYFAYMEDVDFGLRAAWLGHRALYDPRAVVRHVGSASTGGMINPATVRLSTRNLIRTQLRNLPLPLALRWAPRLAIGHAYWCLKMAVKERHPWSWLRGALAGWASVIADRRSCAALQRRRRIDFETFRRRWALSKREVTASIRAKRRGDTTPSGGASEASRG